MQSAMARPSPGLASSSVPGVMGLVLPAAGRHFRHAAALLRATPARFGARLAMVHVVPGAFRSTSLAHLRAGLAHRGSKLAAASHVTRRQAADLGAVDVESNASGHRLGIGFGEARGSAVIAGEGALVARLDAAMESLMGHGEVSSVGLRCWDVGTAVPIEM
jgi:hypothetical protein